jgi:hypothetical protein
MPEKGGNGPVCMENEKTGKLGVYRPIRAKNRAYGH